MTNLQDYRTPLTIGEFIQLQNYYGLFPYYTASAKISPVKTVAPEAATMVGADHPFMKPNFVEEKSIDN